MQTRYNLTKSLGKGSGTVVALIELGDLSSAESDLSTYRTTFGLGTATFKKFNQYGEQSSYPESCEDFGWCVETDLDIQMVSSSCPKCTIYLIEGGNCGGVVCGLEGAESEAVTLGAKILSNSWGCSSFNYGENCGDSNFPNDFNTPGVAYLASSGDSGYPEIEWPAALANVLAVGGTQLAETGSTFSETVWDGAGAGCERRPLSRRGSTILTAPAERSRTSRPRPAVAPALPRYQQLRRLDDRLRDERRISAHGWYRRLVNNPGSLTGGKTFWKLNAKKRKKELHAVTSGSDGSCGDYLCEAGLSKTDGGYKKYSGPAGWGTPNGIGAY